MIWRLDLTNKSTNIMTKDKDKKTKKIKKNMKMKDKKAKNKKDFIHCDSN